MSEVLEIVHINGRFSTEENRHVPLAGIAENSADLQFKILRRNARAAKKVIDTGGVVLYRQNTGNVTPEMHRRLQTQIDDADPFLHWIVDLKDDPSFHVYSEGVGLGSRDAQAFRDFEEAQANRFGRVRFGGMLLKPCVYHCADALGSRVEDVEIVVDRDLCYDLHSS